jgi:hypothetical protein
LLKAETAECFCKEDKKYIAPWQTGPEIQLLDNAGHAEGKIKTHRAGDLSDLLSIKSINPANQWNTFEIVANKGNLTYMQTERMFCKPPYGLVNGSP